MVKRFGNMVLQENMWNLKVMDITIIFSELGTISKSYKMIKGITNQEGITTISENSEKSAR